MNFARITHAPTMRDETMAIYAIEAVSLEIHALRTKWNAQTQEKCSPSL